MVGKINATLEKVYESINKSKSFVVEAGAGSGKTWTLIEVLKHILETKSALLEKKSQKIACITFTNVAKNEIIERIDNNPLVLVMTIHEFLWHEIKNFQKELIIEIIKFNEQDIKKHIDDLEAKIQKKKIEYSQYGRKFEEGKITHEDVLELSARLFSIYPKLSKIVVNKFPFLFVDEYQDTEPIIIELLLKNLLEVNSDKLIIGFFGDSMQKIYNQGIGKIPQEYFDDHLLDFISKLENFRCSKKVIGLLSKIRPELIQKPAGKNLEGEIIFIFCNNKPDDKKNYEKTIEYLKNVKSWDFEKDTKILLLTHRGIAHRLGYDELLKVYELLSYGRDRLINKEEIYSNFILNKIESLINFYKNKNYHAFIQLLGIEGFIINYHDDKKKIQEIIAKLIEMRNENSVKEVLDYVFKYNLLTKPLRLEEFEIDLTLDDIEDIDIKKEFYQKLMQIKYSEFIKIYEYIEDYTPYSTKHGVKGAEFDNVLIVIDDSSWNQYKFNDVFSGNKSNNNRYDRTLNLLYMCCSRAKNNLALLSLSDMDNIAQKTIINWFGSENVLSIDKI